MNNKIFLFVFSLTLIVVGVAAAKGGNVKDGTHLMGLGLILFVGLAVTGSFKHGR